MYRRMKVNVDRDVKPFWRSVLVVVLPLLLLPLPLVVPYAEARCGYVIILMALYWMTEALPLAVTALIPVFAFPLLGILNTDDVCLVYMKETIMMFIGGLAVAIAVEHCNLHKRIALGVILIVGQSPRRLMAGFMFTTMFLSMWISNTATTAMMVPILDAILSELYQKPGSSSNAEAGQEGVDGEWKLDPRVSPAHQSQMELVVANSTDNIRHDTSSRVDSTDTAREKRQQRQARHMMYFSVMYAANIGGTGVITGTGPNMVLKELLDSMYSEPTGLNFLTWMMFNVPGMLLCVVVAWVWLQIRFMGLLNCRKKSSLSTVSKDREAAVRRVVQTKYRELGPLRFQEGVVLTLFIFLVLLWLFRAPEFIDGWGHIFEEKFGVEVDDATPALLVVFLLFVFPAKLDFWCFRKPNTPARQRGDNNSCLTWEVLQRKMPWGVVLLLGGGFAMAEGAKASGLSTWIGDQLYVFNGVNEVVIVLTVTIMTALLTEVASNSATASILLPVLNELALSINVNPLYLMLPATISCSYAFMLPVATPPNAIVFSAARMRSKEMLTAGIVMNLLCVLVINLMINTLGVALFDLNEMPSWINSTTTG